MGGLPGGGKGMVTPSLARDRRTARIETRPGHLTMGLGRASMLLA